MRQIYFYSPNGYGPVRQAFDPPINGARTHGWTDADDPTTGQIIGVVELDGGCDSEDVIDRLEANGISWLPNHKDNTPIKAEHAQALNRFGVKAGNTTGQAMAAVHAVSGFPPHRCQRF